MLTMIYHLYDENIDRENYVYTVKQAVTKEKHEWKCVINKPKIASCKYKALAKRPIMGGGTVALFDCPERVSGVSCEREGKEQLVTRVKRGLECAGHWVVGIWAIYRPEWPLLWCGTVYTADNAGRLSSASWECTVDTGHSDDRDKERRKAGREVVVAVKERDYECFNACVFQLTAFVYVRGDVDGGGVVRDESFEVGVYLEIIWKISVVLPRLCLIKLHRREKNNRRWSFKDILQSIFWLKGTVHPHICSCSSTFIWVNLYGQYLQH